MRLFQTAPLLFAPLLLGLVVSGCKVDPATGTEAEGPAPTPTRLVIDTPASFPKLQEPADNPTTVQGVELGRMLFYEKRLSADNTMSCSTCHKQELAFTDGRAVSPGIKGISGSRSTMSLANSAWFRAFMWDGAASTLEEQAHMPITNPLEMGSKMEEVVSRLQNTAEYPQKFKLAFGSATITAGNIAKAIAQFERTLVSNKSKFDTYLETNNVDVFTSQERKGFRLFITHPTPGRERGANCGDCHGTGGNLDFKLKTFHNNGLDAIFKDPGRGGMTGNSTDMGLFKVPSLRNIALTAPYMHDGRFGTLREVLEHYNEHVQASSTLSPDMDISNNEPFSGDDRLGLTPQEIEALLAFLNTLTDQSFVTDPRFSDPFKK